MAEAAVSMALETLAGLAKEGVRFLFGVSSQVKELERQLREMQCLLRDVDKRKTESATVANWIKDIRDLAYRAEDVIETYAVEVSSKRGGGFKRIFGGALKECCAVHEIGSEISKIKSEFEGITKSMQDYGITSIIHGETSTSVDDKWKTFPTETDDCFVGKEDELKKLVSLTTNDKQPKVISIWGMGGLGKTTITRKLYHHSHVRRSFKLFAWVCITKKCEARAVWVDILTQLSDKTNEDVMKLSDVQLVEQLCDIQRHERCLIICDDVWEVGHWDSLKRAFPLHVEGSESKILLTTRNKHVANKGYEFELGFLKLDDGWELLKKKAFVYHNISSILAMDEKAFEEIGKKLVKRCGYLPLAISLLGGVLSQKNLDGEWESVYSNMGVYLGGEESTGDVLNLSYDELPYYLKPCFLFMAQFGEDIQVSCQWLCMSWIAHGMIVQKHQRKDMTLMDVAELYLSELSFRCMVLFKDRVLVKARRTVQLHDMVRDLCLSKVEHEDFQINSIVYQGGKFSASWSESLSEDVRMRYLRVEFRKDIEPEDGGSIATHHGYPEKYIRGLRLENFSEKKIIELPRNVVNFCKFKLLKELYLIRFSFARRRLPREIGYLVHLHSLYLPECELDKLPSSIRNLRNLITLDLCGAKNVKVPNVMNDLFHLKTLRLPVYDAENVSKYRLMLDGLDEMETLHFFDSLVHDVKSLKTMKNMRRFMAIIHDNRSLSFMIDTITKNWKYLHTCNLVVREGCEFVGAEDGKGLEILKSIFTLTCELEVMLWTYTGALLQMCETEMITSRLVRLVLRNCRIDHDPMEMLGKIPVLKVLYLYYDSFLGKDMKCHASGFPQLRELLLDCLLNLRQWDVEEGAMPDLYSLKISCCPQLEMIPSGLRFIKPLQKLKIVGIPQLGKRVLASSNGGGEGEDYYKVRHVPSIIIKDE